MSQSRVAQAAERARAAGAELRARPAERTLDSLCQWLEGWRDPASSWRGQLEDALPKATGFSREAVREGLALGMRDWTADSLRNVVASELRTLARAAHPAMASGFGLTGVVLAGSIPMPSLLALTLPLLLHSPVVAKAASRDPITPDLVAKSLGEVDAELGACVEIVSFSHDDEANSEAMFEADCVVATGSDESVARIAARVSPERRLVRYGHKLSVAVLGSEASDGAQLASAAQGLALDIALWDQLGCLSPVVVFVEDPVFGGAQRVASAIASALAELGPRLPRGFVDTADAARVAHERDDAELRAATGSGVECHRVEEAGATVVLETDARWRPAPLHRFLRVVPVRSRAQLFGALAPVSRHLAAVALAGFGADSAPLAQALGELGASRICAPGAMQAPPLGWHHDGQPLLLPLAKICDLEKV